MKTIGEFAKENDVTVKTLHHYEKINLISPISVDEQTGYRYYGESQAKDLQAIMFFKSLGLSLSEIKEVMGTSLDNQTAIRFFSYKKDQAQRDKEHALNRYHKLSTVIDVLKKQGKTKIDYRELIQMSETILHTGKYGRGEFIEKSEKLFNEAKQNKQPLSVVQMDLDRFHDVNKQFGYDVGDVVLQRTQDEIVSVVQSYPYESIVEKKGGDEFSITIKAKPLEVSKLVEDILNHVIDIDYSDVAEGLKVSISAGIAGISSKISSYTQLVHEATIQLFEVKKRHN